MDFVVLARKLRPTRFEHLIGQDTVVRALRNAILTDRVAHAFLFTGSRGVGKTSTARILTKALNCEHPEQGEPCNACSNCTEITSNASPDVYEIDAASNRGIDNIRELRENTKYAPVKSRFKTYIIDEVHMLTTESFNALLKTLEEPPPHVKFILATTNPHRIPETILSRCQRYDFARIPVGRLTDYLVEVTEREGLKLSRAALEVIARNAAGGVRDALTAVDQVVSYAGSEVADDQVLGILGLADHREIFALLGAVLDKDLAAALEAFAAARERGHDLGVVLERLIREVKDYSLYLSLSGAAGGADGQHVAAAAFAEHPPETLAFYGERRGQVTLDELQQLFYLLLEVEEQLKRSDFAQACFEMGLVKACHIQPLVAVHDLLAEVRALAPGAARDNAPPHTTGGGATAGGSAPHSGASQAARIAAQVQSRAREAGSGHGGAHRAGGARRDDDADEAEPGLTHPEPPPAHAAGTTYEPRAEADAETAPPETLDPADPPQDYAPHPALNDPADAAPESGTPLAATPAPDARPRPAAPREAPLPWERRRRPTGSAPPPPSAPLPTDEEEPPEDPQESLAPSNGSAGHAANTMSPAPEPPEPPERNGMSEEDEDVPPDEGPGLCDEPRWRAFVEALAESQPRLASKLRRAEVAEWDDAHALLVPADAANRPTADELAQAGPLLATHLGDSFQLALIDDTSRRANPALTIAGRNRILADLRRKARREAAEGDERVQRLLRIFPGGRIVNVSLSDEPPPTPRSGGEAPNLPDPKRSEDV